MLHNTPFHRLQMKVYILLITIAIVSTLSTTLQLLVQNQDTSTKTASLEDIERQIDNLSSKEQPSKLKFNRVAEIVLANEDPETQIEEVEMVASIGIPFRDNFYYTMMVKRRESFYSLQGDLIYSSTSKRTVLVSARNQYTYFVQIDQKRVLEFHRCRLVHKKPVIQFQYSLEIKNQSTLQVDKVFISHHSNNKHFIIVDNSGFIIVSDRQNNTIQQIDTQQSILQTQKLNHNFVVLTQKELFFLNLNKNYTKISCLLPQGSINYFKFQDSNFRYIYGIKQGMMYQFQLTHQCKITRVLYIPLNSTIQIASQMAFILAKSKHYVLNLTSGELKPYRLPIAECVGQQKISIMRKIHSTYVLSRMCLQNHKLNIHVMSIDLHEEQSKAPDFSKFRIPLLLLSFGVIIYMTVRNKKKEKAEEQSEQQIRLRLFQQYPYLREAAIKEQAARLRSTLNESSVQRESKHVQKNSAFIKTKIV